MSSCKININEMSALKAASISCSHLDRGYLFAHINSQDHPFDLLDNKPHIQPISFDGVAIVVMMSGPHSVQLNMKDVEIDKNTVLVLNSEIMMTCPDIDLSRMDAYMLFISREFLYDINLDYNVVDINLFAHFECPVFKLSDDEIERVCGYMHLLHLNASCSSTSPYTRSIARNLISALTYTMMLIAGTHLSAKEQTLSDSATSHANRKNNRKITYLREFIKLIQVHYRQHHDVTFYADKLFITPKYLSMIVKQTCGQSATQLLNERLLQEAKNMLRYSGKNIQQIAYELNFVNQSAFGKFFKHLTGISPTQYQRGS